MQELEQILSQSRAAEPFKADVISYCDRGDATRIRVDGWLPPVKVARLLKHILASEAELPIEELSLRGYSGCSDFTGTVEVTTQSGTHVYDFVWDCRWRAQQEGWSDYFGFPDQMRAAREFDWRCFQTWRKRTA